jgi:DNA-binding NarL/FixJ family response regulator
VLDGTVDPDRVDTAARGLHAAGRAQDGASLAALAATRTADRKATAALLDRARQLQGRPARGRAPAPPVESATPGVLSERELEVASLVVSGLTYKQIGDRLFISPKTIEHHVARIRQRLGCESRADLLVRLRHVVGGLPAPTAG